MTRNLRRVAAMSKLHLVPGSLLVPRLCLGTHYLAGSACRFVGAAAFSRFFWNSATQADGSGGRVLGTPRTRSTARHDRVLGVPRTRPPLIAWEREAIYLPHRVCLLLAVCVVLAFVMPQRLSAQGPLANLFLKKDPPLLVEAKELEATLPKLLAQERFPEAERTARKAMENYVSLYGASDVRVVPSMNTLASIFRMIGRLDEAEQLCKRSLAIVEERKGEDHLQVVPCLQNLAAVCEARGRHQEAVRHLRRALQIIDSRLEENHIESAPIFAMLADIYRRTGRLQEAETLQRRRLGIVQTRLGAGHAETASCLYDLAVVCHERNRLADAETLLIQSVYTRAGRPGTRASGRGRQPQ